MAVSRAPAKGLGTLVSRCHVHPGPQLYNGHGQKPRAAAKLKHLDPCIRHAAALSHVALRRCVLYLLHSCGLRWFRSLATEQGGPRISCPGKKVLRGRPGAQSRCALGHKRLLLLADEGQAWLDEKMPVRRCIIGARHGLAHAGVQLLVHIMPLLLCSAHDRFEQLRLVARQQRVLLQPLTLQQRHQHVLLKLCCPFHCTAALSSFIASASLSLQPKRCQRTPAGNPLRNTRLRHQLIPLPLRHAVVCTTTKQQTKLSACVPS